MTWLQLKVRHINGSIVIADGHIHYAAPVQQEIVAMCRFDGADLDTAMARLTSTGKTRFKLDCTIDAHGSEAAHFTGDYAVRLHQAPVNEG